MPLRLDPRSLDQVIRNLERLGERADLLGRAAVEGSGAIALDALKRNLSGRVRPPPGVHPYARRGEAGKAKAGVDHRVNQQTGRLLSSAKGKRIGGGRTFRIYLDSGIAPHALYVVNGTRVMVPRDVVNASVAEIRTRRDILTFVRALFRGLVRGVVG